MVHGKDSKRWSNDKNRFERAKERIGDDRLSAANGGARKGS